MVQSILSAEKVPLLASACLVVAGMLLTGCMSTKQAHKCLKWDVYLTVACAFGISNALQESGTAGVIATGLVNAGACATLCACCCASCRAWLHGLLCAWCVCGGIMRLRCASGMQAHAVDA